ncbi:MAG: hypothetical protein IKI73_04660 [Firmicutes bacterium]|nr:hypothetical protein [Bacillota bacterium]MBR6237348.1 hypothetical protein [Bacillota bacterium]
MIQTPFFKEICKTYDLSIHYTEETIVLSDPQSDAFIEVSQDEYFMDSKKAKTITEYTVCFSTQHRHFNSLEEAEEYVRLILSDEVLPIEFFDDDRARFGGEIGKDDLSNISAQRLAQLFGHSVEYLSQLSFEVHSWSGENDIKRTKVLEISNML